MPIFDIVMRYIYHIYLLILSIFCLTNCMVMDNADQIEDAEKTTLVRVGDAAPDFTVEFLSGEEATLSQLQGNTVLLVFFNTENNDCKAQLGLLNGVMEQFDGKNFELLAIACGQSKQDIEKFKQENDYHFNIGVDTDNSIFSLYATRHVPRCFVIDPLGHIIATSAGYRLDDFELMLDVIANNLK